MARLDREWLGRIEEFELVVGVFDFALERWLRQLGADKQLAGVAHALTSDQDYTDPWLFTKVYEWWKTIVGGRVVMC